MYRRERRKEKRQDVTRVKTVLSKNKKKKKKKTRSGDIRSVVESNFLLIVATTRVRVFRLTISARFMQRLTTERDFY